MKYLKEIERLGGIKALYEEKPIMDLNEFILLEKKFSNSIPIDYKDFILNNPVSTFNKLISFDAINKQPEYRHPKEFDFPNYIFDSSSISVLFSKDNDVYDLSWNISNYVDRIPSDMLPIFTDGMGNLGLLSMQRVKYEKIYFWDHELEWDVDDYFDETGTEMPEDAKFQNLWLIGNSFTDFLSRCYISNVSD
jgi:hypothetical protein